MDYVCPFRWPQCRLYQFSRLNWNISILQCQAVSRNRKRLETTFCKRWQVWRQSQSHLPAPSTTLARFFHIHSRGSISCCKSISRELLVVLSGGKVIAGWRLPCWQDDLVVWEPGGLLWYPCLYPNPTSDPWKISRACLPLHTCRESRRGDLTTTCLLDGSDRYIYSSKTCLSLRAHPMVG